MERMEERVAETLYDPLHVPFRFTVGRLAFMQAQRYWVKRPFQDARNQCNMGDCQARGWVRLASSYVNGAVRSAVHAGAKVTTPVGYSSLLSCPDVATLLKSVLPKKDISEDELLRQLEVRHGKRQASIAATYRKQKKRAVASCCMLAKVD